MPRQEPLNDEQRGLLRIAARMPLASVANLAPVLELEEERVRRMLGALRSVGWVTSVVRGMTERRQHRWFLTRRAVDLLYVTDHQHPAPREEARAAGLAAFHPEGELPEDYRRRFALDHDHPVHLEGQGDSPFTAGDPADANGDGPDHEHPPWTATSRGIESSLRRLAMLEPVYRLAPDLIRSGRVNLPADNNAASREVRMTDFRLLRHGGFYHAVARYGQDVWTPFTYAGLHATERALRRKEQHRFWGVDCYSHEEDRYLRIGNRVFYEDPDQEVEPSAQVVVAVDSWARHLARNRLSGDTPTLFCTPDGQCTPAVELRSSRDLVSNPPAIPPWAVRGGEPVAPGEPGHGGHRRPAGPPAVPYHLPVSRHAGLLAPGGRGQLLRRGHPPPGAVRPDRPGGGVRREALPVGAGDEAGGQHEPGAALDYPQPPRPLPGPLVPGARAAPQRRGEPAGGALRQGGRGGRRRLAGEVNVPGLTQVRPDLLVQVSDGTLGREPTASSSSAGRFNPSRWRRSWVPTAVWPRRAGRYPC